MNNELYNSIKEELNSLEGESAKVNNVCALLNEKLKDKTSKDIFTTTYAFYEYMIEKDDNHPNKWSYYEEILKNRGIRKAFDENAENFDIYASVIKEENGNYVLDSITEKEDWDLVQKAIEELSE